MLGFFPLKHFNELALNSVSQGYQVSLKSSLGPIDVFLCPDSSSGACSPVAGSSPSKAEVDPALALPVVQSPQRSLASAQEVRSSSPDSTSSTVTAVSQHDSASIVLPGETGKDAR